MKSLSRNRTGPPLFAFWVATVFFSLHPGGASGETLEDICRFFYDRLQPIPHDRLTLKKGSMTLHSDGRESFGCEVDFGSREQLLPSTEPLPDFNAGQGGLMYELGWRQNDNYTADGPGSGLSGIERQGTLCLISWDQHAWINDAGVYEHSELINMTVQCIAPPSTPQ